MQFTIHIPAYHSVERGDVAPREFTMRLDTLPRKGDQIAVPKGGLVEVGSVRHRPVWTDDSGDDLFDTYGPDFAFSEIEPYVMTSWVTRPVDAPKHRSRRTV